MLLIVSVIVYLRIRLAKEKRAFLRRVPTPKDLFNENQVGYPEDKMSMEEAERIHRYRRKETLMDEFMNRDGRYNELSTQFFLGLAVFTGIAIWTWLMML